LREREREREKERERKREKKKLFINWFVENSRHGWKTEVLEAKAFSAHVRRFFAQTKPLAGHTGGSISPPTTLLMLVSQLSGDYYCSAWNHFTAL
jgi:hypothetical protein